MHYVIITHIPYCNPAMHDLLSGKDVPRAVLSLRTSLHQTTNHSGVVAVQVQIHNQLSPAWHPTDEVVYYPHRLDKTHQWFVGAHKTLKTPLQDKSRCRLKQSLMHDNWWRAALNSSGEDAVLTTRGRRFQSLMVRGKKECRWRVDLDLVCCSLFCEAERRLPLQNGGLKSSSMATWSIIQYLVHHGTSWFFAMSSEVVPSKVFH